FFKHKLDGFMLIDFGRESFTDFLDQSFEFKVPTKDDLLGDFFAEFAQWLKQNNDDACGQQRIENKKLNRLVGLAGSGNQRKDPGQNNRLNGKGDAAA